MFLTPPPPLSPSTPASPGSIVRACARLLNSLPHLRRSLRTIHTKAATITAVLSFFPGQFTRLTPLSTFKELLSEGDLSDIWSSGFTDSEQPAC